MAEIIPNRVPCGSKSGSATPKVTPVTATTINGITYFKLKPDPNNPRYDGDYTKNCGLLGNEIDENFFYLRNVYIYTAYTENIDGKQTLVLERVNGDKIFVNVGNHVAHVDDQGHILIDGVPVTDESGEPVTFLIEGRDVHIVTDPSIQGDGSYGKAIGVDLAHRTGTYAPADFFADLTCGDTNLGDFTDIGYGHAIVTKENCGRFGALYTFSQAEKLNNTLKSVYGEKGWRIPSKEDWAKLLNWAEGCDGVQNHDTDDCGNFGKFAGKRLKSVGFWNATSESKKPVDEFGFSIYPVGVCPDVYNAAQPKEFGFVGLYDVTTFWSSSKLNGQAYTRTFSYDHNDVAQFSESVKKRFSIRLVKDIDVAEYDIPAYADILGNYLPVMQTSDGKQLWTSINVSIFDYEGFNWKEVTIPDAWKDVETNVPAVAFYQLVESGDSFVYTEIEEYEIPSTAVVETVEVFPENPDSASSEYIKYEYTIHLDMSTEPKFFFNAWDGETWHKKMMKEGESVVLIGEDYPNTCDSAATVYVTSANTMHEWRLYSNDQTGLDELIDTLDALKKEFQKEFDEINERIDDLSATTEEFSAATVEEIARLDERIDDEEARAISAETELHERIDALEIASAETPDDTILASYILREGPDGEQKGVRIDIPKDKAIYSIAVGDMGDEFGEPYEGNVHQTEFPDNILSASTGEEAIRVIYQRNNGIYEMVLVPVDDFLQIDEFEDGLEVVDGETSKVVKVKIDPASDWFLTVSMSGVSLTGVDAALDNIVLDVIGGEGSSESGYSIDFYEGKWSEVSQEECDSHPHTIVDELPDAKTWTGTTYVEVFDGINHSYYKRVSGTNYISDSETILDALNALDAALKDESDRAQAAEQALDEKIDAETERAMSAETVLHDEIVAETERATSAETKLHEEIVAETERATSAETVLQEEIVAETERAISAETVLHEEIVTETERAMSAETALQVQLDELSAATMELSASTSSEIERLDQRIDDEIARATAAEESISGDVTTLSATVESFSAATVAELERLDGQDIADGDYTLTVQDGLTLSRKNGTDTITIGFDGDYGEFGE